MILLLMCRRFKFFASGEKGLSISEAPSWKKAFEAKQGIVGPSLTVGYWSKKR